MSIDKTKDTKSKTHKPSINLEETLIKSTNIFNGGFIDVYKDTVKLPDGGCAEREYINHAGATAIIAITTDKQIVLEYQYRHPIKRIMLEIPAGKLEANEITIECAKRELWEETGYTSNQWVLLGEAFPCIGYSNEKITYYLAQDVMAGTTHLDAGEFIETITMPINEFMQNIYNGTINDSKTISGAMLYLGFLSKNKK